MKNKLLNIYIFIHPFIYSTLEYPETVWLDFLLIFVRNKIERFFPEVKRKEDGMKSER